MAYHPDVVGILEIPAAFGTVAMIFCLVILAGFLVSKSIVATTALVQADPVTSRVHMLFHCVLRPEELFACVAFKLGSRVIQCLEMLLAGLEVVEPSAAGPAGAEGHFEPGRLGPANYATSERRE
jgi:hypothetical protein